MEDEIVVTAPHRTRRSLDRQQLLRVVTFVIVVGVALVFAYWHVGRQRVDVDEDV
ncbi:hypothetical protein [Curtobacterium sp. MCLR17_058]|uniref:hypothetical protein n=1 Tax=Curtobacterium sp. MCLR17_058 TaxID=2175635 RepID=UPI0024DF5FA0|nr:hypothetical protein [Curtobacterium sp. MCLR17_058]WIB42825.1 hypothetical protein DEJ11_00540 [Curtobacterium sp. MCLR17_058]